MWCPRCCLSAVRLNAARMSGAASVVGGSDKRKKIEEEEEEESALGLQGHGQPPTKKLRNKKGKGDRYVPPPGKKNLGISFGHQHFNETQYYFENGLRKVFPYYFDFQTYCKGRWVGKTLREVFSSEFRIEPIEYYSQAAKAGRIRLNEETADLNTVLKNNDFMRNTVHRHEPPVTDQPLTILTQNQEVVVVDKPASIPVHPCGRFRHNTVIFILGKEHGLTELHTIHRLDRLASGVLMFAKTVEVSKKMDQQVRERQVEKEYVCRVQGEFPDGEITCEEPILTISYKVGVCRVHPKGKPCKTVFQKLSYNGVSSVVHCSPYTGRTHQIRVHLQYLGHPIVNDPVYNTEAWGPNRGRGGTLDKTDDELLKTLVDDHRLKESLDLLEVDHHCTGEDDHKGSTNFTPPHVDETEPSADKKSNGAEEGTGKASDDNSLEPTASEREVKPVPVKDNLCGECKLLRKDPSAKDLIMYLHALKYKGLDWEYSSPLPNWATADWQED
ncbi:RNA pseudouridylate synthase domain-containing protein 2 [Chiloscyllium plagiosum]|uniref:RNA pseudouridylate synthase domain-containing protein 2 n=1 Tax=Chiloscyllium plagiosum TaxID=36176 RepID=UPI001CB7C14A|nr:RNA pseudouridylate synthase domain-containing protein 2 [Chiloscyllium plagiosum]